MKKRLVYIDILKIIAIFLVLYNHTMGFIQFTTANIYSKRIWIYIYSSILTKINVPIFMMASGALLLKKDMTIKTVLQKAAKFFIVFLLSSIILFALKNNGKFTICTFLASFMNCDIDPSYWYMYAYIGFLLFAPYIKRIVSGLKTSDFIYISIFYCIIHTLIPTINYIAGGKFLIELPKHLYLPLVTVQIYFYAIVGYYMAHVMNIKKISTKKVWLIIVIPSLLFTMVPTYFTYKTGIIGGFGQQYFEYGNFFIAVAVFILFRKLFEGINAETRSSKIISTIGTLTLGMYLFEPMIKSVLYKHIFNIAAYATKSIVIISILWCIIAMSICGIITFILKKLPVVKKVL